jgi:hypothetical protein
MSQAHFETLGLAPTSTKTEILSANRKLSLKCHPDKGGDAAAFVQLGEAKDACLAYLEQPAVSPAPPPSPSSTPMTPREFMAQRTAGQAYSDFSAADVKPFTYGRTKLSDFVHKVARLHKVQFAKRVRTRQERWAREAQAQKCAQEEDILAQVMRFTQMQAEARAQGIKC